MKIPFSWLKEFVSIDVDPYMVAEHLTMAGIETSSVEHLGEGLSGIVAGNIKKIEKHPHADRLSLCVVSDGREEHSVVCGAKNIIRGDTVPLALVGAKLPGGEEIRKAKIRGIASEGMLCSERELGISDNHEGIMILPDGVNAGTLITDALSLDDYLLEVEITPNRGDCLSIFGVAREISAIFEAPLIKPDVHFDEKEREIEKSVTICVEDFDLCPRYSSRVVLGLQIGPSPFWLRRRLTLCGIRPINNIVDITNYLLLEMGQPMHAFDLHHLAGRKIRVGRAGGSVSEFTTLDGVERKIDDETLLIWDGEKPVAIAGIMGGENSEVSDGTREVLFESAHFDPLSIRRSGRRLGISTESSYRFERGVDPSGTLYALDRALSLLSTFTPFKACKGHIDERGWVDGKRFVSFRPGRASEIIGLPLTAEDSRKVFQGLGFSVKDQGEDSLEVQIPSFRFDIEREIDLVEEVVRIKGYSTIPTTYPPSGSPQPSINHDFFSFLTNVTDHLSTLGFQETINYSFLSEKLYDSFRSFSPHIPEKALSLANPISEDTKVMRPTLLAGLLGNAYTNISRNQKQLKLFEIGKIFKSSLQDKGYEEVRAVGIITGRLFPDSWEEKEKYPTFSYVRGIVENLFASNGIREFQCIPALEENLYSPKESARIDINGKTAGYIGKINEKVSLLFDIHQKVYCFDIDMEALFEKKGETPTFSGISKFPSVERDISFLVNNDISVGDIIAYVRLVDASLIKKVQIFDLYRSENIGFSRKSVGIRVTYQADNRTLTEQEVNDIHKEITALVDNRFGGEVRRS